MIKTFKPFSTQQKKHFRVVPQTNAGKLEGIDGKPTLTLDQPSLDAGVTLSIDEDGFGGTIVPDKTKPAPAAAYNVSVEADADLSEQVALITSGVTGSILEPQAQVLDVAEEDAVDQ